MTIFETSLLENTYSTVFQCKFTWMIPDIRTICTWVSFTFHTTILLGFISLLKIWYRVFFCQPLLSLFSLVISLTSLLKSINLVSDAHIQSNAFVLNYNCIAIYIVSGCEIS